MSLTQIIEEQGSIRELISELQERLSVNEAKIAGLMNQNGGAGGAGAAGRGRPAMRPMGGRGGGGGGYPAQGPKARSPTMGNMPQQRLGGYTSPQQQQQAAGYSTLSPPMWASPRAGGTRTSTTEELKSMVQSIVNPRGRGAAADVWAEEKEGTSIAGIDRCEALMKKAFDEYRKSMATRTTASPFTALQSIIRQIDSNHSGKTDMNEFMQMPRVLGFQAQPASLKALFERYDLDHSGLIDDQEFCRMLWKPAGDVEARAKSVIAKMREVLVYRAGGFPSMQAMGRQFRIIDRDRSGKLDKEEMDIMLDNFFNYWQIKFTPEEKKSLFVFFDREGDGYVNYSEYIRAVRGEMNPFREDLVKQAFSVLDMDGSGVITVDEIASKYDVSKNPDVQSGKISSNEAFTLFMNNFDQNQDGSITLDEFMESYQWISASIDNDDYFELMMRNAWHMGGGEGWAANTSNLAVLVTYNDGRQEVVQLMNDLGLDKYDERAVAQRLYQQGDRKSVV